MDILKKLGFGTMRLPVDENEDINYELIGQMEMLCGSLMRDIAKCKRSVRIGNSVKAVLFLRIKTRTKSKEKCDL